MAQLHGVLPASTAALEVGLVCASTTLPSTLALAAASCNGADSQRVGESNDQNLWVALGG
jgi:hypothetical protein